MSKILIFSDNNALIKLWSAALSIKYQVNTVDDIYADITADAIIIDELFDPDLSLVEVGHTAKDRMTLVGELRAHNPEKTANNKITEKHFKIQKT